MEGDCAERPDREAPSMDDAPANASDLHSCAVHLELLGELLRRLGDRDAEPAGPNGEGAAEAAGARLQFSLASSSAALAEALDRHQGAPQRHRGDQRFPYSAGTSSTPLARASSKQSTTVDKSAFAEAEAADLSPPQSLDYSFSQVLTQARERRISGDNVFGHDADAGVGHELSGVGHELSGTMPTPASRSSSKRNNDSSSSIRRQSATGMRRETDFLRRDSLNSGRLAAVMASPHVEVMTGFLILLNTLAMAVEQQHEGLRLGAELSVYSPAVLEAWPLSKSDFELMEKVFAGIFTIELGLHIFAERWKYFRDGFNAIDVFVVLLSDIAAFGPAIWGHFNFQVFRLLRIARLLRLLRLIRRIKGFDALYVMTTAFRCSISILAWSCVLILMIQTLFAMMLTDILRETYLSSDKPLEEQKEVFVYFGTFTRSMLSMLELTLANWPPIARMLTENVSEWFAPVCMMHKLVIGFAVVGIINGVFMQETFKVASTDDYIMMRTQQQAGLRHEDNMRKLFALADQDGDGRVNREDLEAALNDQSVRSWIAAMELDCEDLNRMFALMNAEVGGCGYITKESFVHCMARMKGPARNLDVKEILYRTQAASCGEVKIRVPTGSSQQLSSEGQQFSSEECHSSTASGHSRQTLAAPGDDFGSLSARPRW